METIFYGVYSCDFCHKYIFEILGTPHSHFHTCIGTTILHTIIPVNLLPDKINHRQLEVFGSNSTTVQLFPEPGLLRCGYCNQDFPRSSIAYHVFYCRSGLMFEFLDQTGKDQNGTYKEYVPTQAVRLEFILFSFPFLIVRLAWFLPFLSRKVSIYQQLCHTIKTVAL